jgi:S-disulfanyl-L-cysteine oxidoreductase SoxD
MFKWLMLIAAIGAVTLSSSQQTRYGLGRPATPEEIRARDISVNPTGAGLPHGHGSAVDGRGVYDAKCASCHGDKGQGNKIYPALVGGQGTLRNANPVRTVGSYWPYPTTLWDYIHRSMPYQTPGTLTPDESYAATAYILYLNGIVEEKEDLNKKTLPKVKMPNRDGFVPDPRPDVKAGSNRASNLGDPTANQK